AARRLGRRAGDGWSGRADLRPGEGERLGLDLARSCDKPRRGGRSARDLRRALPAGQQSPCRAGHVPPPHLPGAALVMAPFSITFGAMLLSLVLWEQGSWGWSALATGLAIAPGPLLVPITAMLVAGRLIQRLGAANVIVLGLGFFGGGCVWWALAVNLEPNL